VLRAEPVWKSKLQFVLEPPISRQTTVERTEYIESYSRIRNWVLPHLQHCPSYEFALHGMRGFRLLLIGAMDCLMSTFIQVRDLNGCQIRVEET